MRSTVHFSSFGLFGPTLLLWVMALSAVPGAAQDVSNEGDPFAGVSVVGDAHMSSVSGQPIVPGQSDTPGGDSGADATTSLATPINRQATFNNSTGTHVTAVNVQSSRLGSATIETGGGINIGGGN